MGCSNAGTSGDPHVSHENLTSSGAHIEENERDSVPTHLPAPEGIRGDGTTSEDDDANLRTGSNENDDDEMVLSNDSSVESEMLQSSHAVSERLDLDPESSSESTSHKVEESSVIAAMDTLTFSVDKIGTILHVIHALLQEQKDERKKQLKDDKLEKLQQSSNEMASVIAVMAVFIAAIGAALLSYTNDVYANRSSSDSSAAAPGAKSTDKITISCFFMAILFALAPASFAGLTKHRATVRAMARVKQWVMDLLGKRVVFQGHEKGKSSTTEQPEASSTESLTDTNDAYIVNDGPVWIISFLGPSLALLTSGIVVFCWAEQSRSVAYAATAALGYSTVRMTVFFVNSIRLSDNGGKEEKREDSKRAEEAMKRFVEDVDVRYQFVHNYQPRGAMAAQMLLA